MPEEIEIDTDKLREAIDEEIDRKEGPLLRWISLTTAILAVLAAIAALQAGSTVNEALVLKTDATRLQAQASDQWAYYQAKGIKGAVAQGEINDWAVVGKTAPAALAAQVTRYSAQQDTIRDSATALEHQRDEKSHDADQLLKTHEGYAAAVALFQIAIALGAIAALTRIKPIWLTSLVAGAIGVMLMGRALLHPG